MRGCRMCIAAAIATIGLAPAAARAQAQQQAAATAAASRDDIKRELDKLKKARTLAINPADGSDDTAGATILRFENSSPFSMVILVVGPTTERVELGPERMQTL